MYFSFHLKDHLGICSKSVSMEEPIVEILRAAVFEFGVKYIGNLDGSHT